MRLFARRELLLLVACIVACAVFSLASPYFLTAGNLSTILRNSVELLIIALGMSLILATAGIDISVGAAMGICAVFIGFAIQAGLPWYVVGLVGPVIGTLLGILTASAIVFGRVPPIIATLGMYGIYRAAIFLILGGRWIAGLPGVLDPVVSATIFGIPVLVFEIVVLYFMGFVVLRWTPLGTALLAIGGNAQAARLSGINVAKTKFLVYAFTGSLVGFSAMLYVARYRNVETGIGSTIALDAIVAAILGGSSILGGKANLVGTALGGHPRRLEHPWR